MSSYVRTPDGRILVELDKHGRADASRHGEMMVIKGEVVETLRTVNRGATTVPRDDFRTRQADLLPAFQEAAGRIGALHRTQSDLLDESRVLNRIASEGFDALGGEMAGVRQEVRGVRTDLGELGEKKTY